MTDHCEEMTTLLARAADGAPVDSDTARLDAHLATCPSCREALAGQRAMRELLQAYPVQGARLGFDSRVMAAVRAEAEGRARSWIDSLDFRRWTWRLVPVAAALALTVAVVAERDSAIYETTDETSIISETTDDDGLPVSSALWSESVSESSLLSLMLTASADDTLGTYRKEP